MSGRYTFVAGNTLTAAQLNTNVMDGIFYKAQTGTISVPMTSGTPWSTGTVNVTNLTGFTTTPVMFCTPLSGVAVVIAHVDTISTTTATIRCNYYGASATSRVVKWLAVQATSTTAEGS